MVKSGFHINLCVNSILGVSSIAVIFYYHMAYVAIPKVGTAPAINTSLMNYVE